MESMRNIVKSGVQVALGTAGLSVVRKEPYSDARATLDTILDSWQVDCVIDVGANAGQFGQLVRSTGYTGWLVSFEPGTVAFADLTDQCARDDKWLAHDVALGRTREKKELSVSSANKLSSLLKPDSASMADWYPQPRSVTAVEITEVHRLDEFISYWLRETGTERVYLKRDTQGYDLEVLAGATGILDSVVAVQTEVVFKPLYENVPDISESLRTLKDLGFEPVGLFPISRHQDARLIEMDCMAVKKLRIESKEERRG